jgi:hypothetical protein
MRDILFRAFAKGVANAFGGVFVFSVIGAGYLIWTNFPKLSNSDNSMDVDDNISDLDIQEVITRQNEVRVEHFRELFNDF